MTVDDFVGNRETGTVLFINPNGDIRVYSETGNVLIQRGLPVVLRKILLTNPRKFVGRAVVYQTSTGLAPARFVGWLWKEEGP